MNRYVLLLLLLVLPFSSALGFDASTNKGVLVTEIPSFFEFDVSLSNVSSGDYNFFTLSDVSLDPSQIFSLDKGDHDFVLTLSPTENLDVSGLYVFSYTLNQRGVEKFDRQFSLEILPLKEVFEVSAVTSGPGDDSVDLTVKNTADVFLPNVSFSFSSVLFSSDRVLSFAPFEEQEITIFADASKVKTTKAGVYVLEAVVDGLDGDVSLSGNLFLGEKKGVATLDDSSGFLVRKRTISKVNAGNVLEDVKVSLSKNIVTRLFTSFDRDPNLVVRDGFFVEYLWEKRRLGPGDSFTVTVSTNYVIPLLIILVFVGVVMFVRRLANSTVEVRKSVVPVRTKNGEFALRIKIALKARRKVDNCSVVDKVPRIVKIYNKFGTLRPDKIDVHSRRLHWHLGSLDAGEVRMLSYVVYSKVGFVGKLSLPSTLAVFEKDGEVKEVESNRVFFLNEQVSGDE